jgi:Glycosyl transferase family 2
VSIIIPTHNYAGYVGQAIRSALQQGYGPVEVVVVDDGSTDDTPAVLREFGSAIRSVRLEGRGVSAARNAGLGLARGEYVVLLDADDLLVPGGVAAQVAWFEGHPDLDAVVGDWYTCDVPSGTIVRNRSSLRGDALPHLLRTNIVATPSAVMLRRATLVALGGFDTSLGFTADWEMWLRLARQGRGFACVTAPTAVYRVHQRSMTSRLDEAIADVTAFLDRCFGDAALPESLRAVEPESRFGAMMYLGQLCLQQDDHPRGGECVRRALRWNPGAVDTLHFYRCLAGATSRGGLQSGRAVVDVVESMLTLCAGLDLGRDERPRRRQALRHLAAGMIARNAGDLRLGVRHLRLAARGSWPTVLAPPQLGGTARLLVPPGMIGAARRIFDRIRFGSRAGVPPAVRALLGGGGKP